VGNLVEDPWGPDPHRSARPGKWGSQGPIFASSVFRGRPLFKDSFQALPYIDINPHGKGPRLWTLPFEAAEPSTAPVFTGVTL
jgi:hypothetical protein